jgi:hypothetical protein
VISVWSIEERPVAIREAEGRTGEIHLTRRCAVWVDFRVLLRTPERKPLIENQRALPVFWKRP